MSTSIKLSITFTFGLSMAALAAGCTGSAQVQATTPTVSANVSTTAAATPAPQPAPMPPPQPLVSTPVVGGGVGVGVVGTTGMVGTGVVSVGGAVGPNWMATGYAVNDWVSYNMTLRARQFANGMIPVTELVRGMMRNGERRTVIVTAAAGHCYRVIGVGGAGVRDLDLYLRDMAGHIIDQDRAPDNFPVIGLDRQLCVPVAGTVQLEIVMFSGNGEIGVQAFATP